MKARSKRARSKQIANVTGTRPPIRLANMNATAWAIPCNQIPRQNKLSGPCSDCWHCWACSSSSCWCTCCAWNILTRASSLALTDCACSRLSWQGLCLCPLPVVLLCTGVRAGGFGGGGGMALRDVLAGDEAGWAGVAGAAGAGVAVAAGVAGGGMVEYLAYSSVWNACTWKNFSGPKQIFLPAAFFAT